MQLHEMGATAIADGVRKGDLKAISTGMDLASGGDTFAAGTKHNEEVGGVPTDHRAYSFWNMRTPMIHHDQQQARSRRGPHA